MEELEKLHKRNIDIQDQRRLEEERNRLASQKQKKKLRELLEKRKAELGVTYERKPIPDGLDKASNQSTKALILEDGVVEQEGDRSQQKLS